MLYLHVLYLKELLIHQWILKKCRDGEKKTKETAYGYGLQFTGIG